MRFARRLLGVIGLALAAGPAAAGSVWVASQQGARATRIERPEGAPAIALAVAPSPAVVTAGPGGRLYLSHPDGRAITMIAADGTTRQWPVPGQPFGLAADPDGRSLYVGDWSGNRVLRLSAETGAVEAEVAVGRDPAGLTLGANGRLYVAEREGRSVGVVDTARMARIAGIPVGDGPFALAYDPVRDRVYVANVRSNDLSVIDAGTLKPVATVPVGASPYGVAISPDGRRVVVTNQHSGTISIVEADTLAVAATVPVGRYPEGVAILGGRAYVANWFSDDISVIDLAASKETGRIPVAEGPRTLAVEQPVPGEAVR
ncbi:YncE family protein [Methylobacterium pseudosasicola]|uniref:40-residue YVTN family beta-propeller repeat-containing protein n=1 Tax=Methylobacterium pseudosasicola TaxID=582667 RepID=A0A1I4NQ31_9HYPH|nr:YncE family protein [Methylobacterium pseudosasicola]SFM17450.1 40-residue YVTN family beta-propeller repeat-containing protein [Methylobacterium pseudosasicola]